jgi:hypothetical protein
VQQSQLHLTGQDDAASDGPATALSQNTILLTNWGRIPNLRTPSGLTVEDFRSAILQQPLRLPSVSNPQEPPAPTSTYIVTTCNARLSVELTTAHSAALADDIITAIEQTIDRLTLAFSRRSRSKRRSSNWIRTLNGPQGCQAHRSTKRWRRSGH